jgi:proline dehydrogenase
VSHELRAVALTREEVALVDALLGRVRRLAAAAAGAGVKLMIDAEHSYFQPVSLSAARAHATRGCS